MNVVTSLIAAFIQFIVTTLMTIQCLLIFTVTAWAIPIVNIYAWLTAQLPKAVSWVLFPLHILVLILLPFHGMAYISLRWLKDTPHKFWLLYEDVRFDLKNPE